MIRDNLNLTPLELASFAAAVKAVTAEEDLKLITVKMGNKNQDKLIQSIKAWQKGWFVPEREQFKRFLTALPSSQSAVVDLAYVKFMQARKSKLVRGNEVVGGDFRLLAKHYDLLLRQRAMVLASQQLASIQPLGSHVGCCYAGSDSLKLADLLNLWYQERSQFGPEARLLLASGGSLLSGSGSRTLIYPANDDTQASIGSVRLGSGFGSTLKQVQSLNRGSFTFTDMNLKQLLAELGEYVTEGRVFDAAGDLIASYNYQDHLLSFPEDSGCIDKADIDFQIKKQNAWQAKINIDEQVYIADCYGVQNTMHQYCFFYDDVLPVPVLASLIRHFCQCAESNACDT